MKLTTSQLKKVNRRVHEKYGKNVLFANDTSYTRTVFNVLKPTTNGEYVKGYLQSLLHTETSFENLYYSI